MSDAALRRLSKELHQLSNEPPNGVHVAKDVANDLRWFFRIFSENFAFRVVKRENTVPGVLSSRGGFCEYFKDLQEFI